MIAEIILRNAAQVINRHGRAVLVVLQPGHLARDVRDILETELFERVRIKCRHRGADILHVLLASLGRDGDLGKLVFRLCFSRKTGGPRAERHDDRSGCTVRPRLKYPSVHVTWHHSPGAHLL